MYPLSWTTGKEGIFMRYSYEYRKKAVDLYRQGKWLNTTDGITTKHFHYMIRKWARIEDSCGTDALMHKIHNKDRTPKERYTLVAYEG